MLLLIIISSFLISTNGAVLPPVPILDSRIVGGVPALITDAPYTVSIMLDYWGIGSYFHRCGASILSEGVILTAAHCVEDTPMNRWRMRAGTTFNNNGGFLSYITKIFIHPDFNSELDNDISVLFLTTKLNFTLSPGIAPIDLPNQGQVVEVGAPAFVTGWGTLTEGGIAPSQLYKVTMPIIEQELCVTAYELVNPITDNMICAGRLGIGGQDACDGDSGGPLAINGTLIGITSWGKGCAQPDYPGVWTRVPMYRDWIDSVLQNDTILYSRKI